MSGLSQLRLCQLGGIPVIYFKFTGRHDQDYSSFSVGLYITPMRQSGVIMTVTSKYNTNEELANLRLENKSVILSVNNGGVMKSSQITLDTEFGLCDGETHLITGNLVYVKYV